MNEILHYRTGSGTKQAEVLLVVNEVQKETALAIANEYLLQGLFKGIEIIA